MPRFISVLEHSGAGVKGCEVEAEVSGLCWLHGAAESWQVKGAMTMTMTRLGAFYLFKT